MTTDAAYKILGLNHNADKNTLKKDTYNTKNNTAIIHLTAHVKRKLPGMPK